MKVITHNHQPAHSAQFPAGTPARSSAPRPGRKLRRNPPPPTPHGPKFPAQDHHESLDFPIFLHFFHFRFAARNPGKTAARSVARPAPGRPSGNHHETRIILRSPVISRQLPPGVGVSTAGFQNVPPRERLSGPKCTFQPRHLISRSERLSWGNKLEAGLGSQSRLSANYRFSSPLPKDPSNPGIQLAGCPQPRAHWRTLAGVACA